MKKLFFGQPPSAIKAEMERRQERKKQLDKILHFTAEQAGSTVALTNVAGTYKTSTDGENWTDYTLGDVITLENGGDRVYFSARTQNSTCWDGTYNAKFKMTGMIAGGGNIQYLLDSTGARMGVPNMSYVYMFQNCTSLTTAPELPATTLANYCYYGMFWGCSSLTSLSVTGNIEWGTTKTAMWFYNASSSGTFYAKQSILDDLATKPRGADTVPVTWSTVAI